MAYECECGRHAAGGKLGSCASASRRANTIVLTDVHAFTYADSNIITDAYASASRRADSNSNANAHSITVADSFANNNAYTYAFANRRTDPNAHSIVLADTDAHSRADASTGEQCQSFTYQRNSAYGWSRRDHERFH